MPGPNKGEYGTGYGSSASRSPADLGSKVDHKPELGSGLHSAGDQLSQQARDARNAASDLGSQAGKSAGAAAHEVKQAASNVAQGAKQSAANLAQNASQTTTASAASLKDQAAGVAGEARSTVSAMAEEARHRISEIVDQQKAAGADTVAGVARAAKAAAGDLQQTSPQMARLVRSAAEGVDRVAGDIRSSDLNQIIATLSQFGRRQPVAFFGGAVLTGFILARFLKSDAPQTGAAPARPTPRRV